MKSCPSTHCSAQSTVINTAMLFHVLRLTSPPFLQLFCSYHSLTSNLDISSNWSYFQDCPFILPGETFVYLSRTGLTSSVRAYLSPAKPMKYIGKAESKLNEERQLNKSSSSVWDMNKWHLGRAEREAFCHCKLRRMAISVSVSSQQHTEQEQLHK